MKKSDKLKEKQLIACLNAVCDQAKSDFTGFEWLTHQVSYADFPKSLRIIVVFDTNNNLSQFVLGKSKEAFMRLIKSQLAEIGVVLHQVNQQLTFDTEERCEFEHAGSWAKRLA